LSFFHFNSFIISRNTKVCDVTRNCYAFIA